MAEGAGKRKKKRRKAFWRMEGIAGSEANVTPKWVLTFWITAQLGDKERASQGEQVPRPARLGQERDPTGPHNCRPGRGPPPRLHSRAPRGPLLKESTPFSMVFQTPSRGK